MDPKTVADFSAYTEPKSSAGNKSFHDNRIDIIEELTLIKNNPSFLGSYRITPSVL